MTLVLRRAPSAGAPRRIDGSRALTRDEEAIEDAADRAPRRRCPWCPPGGQCASCRQHDLDARHDHAPGRDLALRRACPACGAAPAEVCRWKSWIRNAPELHEERVRAALPEIFAARAAQDAAYAADGAP